jgi:molecular chaperone GrpE
MGVLSWMRRLWVAASNRAANAASRPAELLEFLADRGRLESDLADIRNELAGARVAEQTLAGEVHALTVGLADVVTAAKAELLAALDDTNAALGNIDDTTVSQAIERSERAVADLFPRFENIGREQFAATTLLEGQGVALDRLADQTEEVKAGLERVLAEQKTLLAELGQTRTALRGEIAEMVRQWVVGEFFAVADGLTESLRAGECVINSLETSSVASTASPAKPVGFIGTLTSRIFGGESSRPGEANAVQRPDTAPTFAAWLEGLRLVERRLVVAFAHAGVEPMATAGSRFDPHRHLAVAVEPSDELPPGTIIREERRGYVAGERVLRPAEVVVAVRTHGEPATLGPQFEQAAGSSSDVAVH